MHTNWHEQIFYWELVWKQSVIELFIERIFFSVISFKIVFVIQWVKFDELIKIMMQADIKAEGKNNKNKK